MDSGGRALRRAGPSPGCRDRLRARQPLRLPDLWRGGLSGPRHRADDLATPQFLSAPSLSERPCAAGALREVRRQEDRPAMGRPDSGFTLLFEAMVMTMVS